MVTTATDVFDVYDGAISLREAVAYADVYAVGTEITFAEELSGACIRLQGFSICVVAGVTISAESLEDGITIDAGFRSRAFCVIAPASESTELIGLTMQNGKGFYGGAIYNEGILRVRDSHLLLNSASGDGGAIYNGAGTLALVNSILVANTASGSYSDGGAIYSSYGSLAVTNSTLACNQAGWRGQAIYIYRQTATLNNCIIAGKERRGSEIYDRGGGFYGCNNFVRYGGSAEKFMIDGEDGNIVGHDTYPSPGFIRMPSDGGDGWGDDPSTPTIDESVNDDYGDLHLHQNSRAVDAGNNTLAVDWNGVPLERDNRGVDRILDGKQDGTATVDMGANEYVLSPTLGYLGWITMASGTSIYIDLDATPVSEGPLTFTVTTSNPNLVTHVPECTTNRSLRMNVQSPENGIDGCMEFQLFEELAPLATERITTLADEGFYDGVTFHRVVEDFMIQGGDPTGTGSGGSGLGPFDDQFSPMLMHTGPGILSMAKSYDDTNDSQFFITDTSTRWLDFNHTVFGYLTEGEGVLDAVSEVPVDANDRPEQDVIITSVEVFHDCEDRVLILHAPDGFTGRVDVRVTVEAEDGGVAGRTFRATVVDDTENSAPYLNEIPAIETMTGRPVRVSLPVTDIDGGELYFDAQVWPGDSQSDA